MFQFVFSIMPIIIFTIIFILKKYKINNISNFIFYGFLSILLAGIFAQIIILICPIVAMDIPTEEFVLYFICNFFIAGIPEELGKYIAIKLSKPKTKTKVLINAIYITLMFTFLETYLKSGLDVKTLEVVIFRMAKPMHVFYGVIMAFFISKGMEDKKNKIGYNFLAVLIPALLHATSNAALNAFDLGYLLKGLIWGVFAYIIPIIVIIKHKPEAEGYNNNKTISIIKMVIVIPIILVGLYISNSGTRYIKINEPCYMENEKIEMTIKSVEQETLTDKNFSSLNGTYIKVTVEVENKSSKTYQFVTSDFRIINNYKEDINPEAMLSTIGDVNSNDKATFELYFKKNIDNDSKLVYQKFLTANAEEHIFNLK